MWHASAQLPEAAPWDKIRHSSYDTMLHARDAMTPCVCYVCVEAHRLRTPLRCSAYLHPSLTIFFERQRESEITYTWPQG